MVRLTTLGAIDARDAKGRPVRELMAQPKRVALLVLIALEGRKGPVSRDRLLAMFWPESDETHARNALSQALHHLRQALGPGVIEGQGASALELAPDRLWCDAAEFAEALERGEFALALDLYRGDFCPALFVSGAPDVEEWLEGMRGRLRRQAVAAGCTLARRLLDQGQTAAASGAARRALALSPDDEADVRTLLEVLDKSGDATGALLAFQDYARRLATELDATPEPKTKQIAESIRRRREPTEPEAPAPGQAPIAAGAERTSRWRHPGIAAALALVLGGIALVASVRRTGSTEAALPEQTVAVFPFTVRGSAGHAYLREGMVDLLTAALESVGGLRATDPRSTFAARERGDGAGSDALARRLGAGRYITGEIMGAGGRLQLRAALHAVGASRPLAGATVSGDSAALFELVDSLTGRLLANLVEGRDTAITRLAALSTASLPALKAFLEGERAMRSGLDAAAVAAFREAATLDTTFALAQYRLALSGTWSVTPGQEPAAVWADRALRNARRLSPLIRDLLTAHLAYREFRFADAERFYRTLTASRPDNVEAWLMLGETTFHSASWRGRPLLDGWEPFRRTLALDPSNVHAPLHLARIAAAEGRDPALDSLARDFAARHRDADRAIEIRALVAYVANDTAGRRAVAQAALAGDEALVSTLIQAATTYAENLEAALELVPVFTAVTRHPATRLVLARILTDVPLQGGDWDGAARRLPAGIVEREWQLESQALLASEPLVAAGPARLRALRAALEAAPRWPPMSRIETDHRDPTGAAMRDYLVGLLSVRLDDTAVVARSLAMLARSPSPGLMRMAAALRAAQARRRGDLRGALAELLRFGPIEEAAPSSLPAHWGIAERFAYADVLFALGQPGEALPLFESFHGPHDGPFAALAHLRAGETAERLGDMEHARLHYGRAVSLWRWPAEEQRTLLARARQGLARLANRRPAS